MSKCSFLSTKEKSISCFKDCPFYKCEETGGICPFKVVERKRVKRLKNYYGYDISKLSMDRFAEKIYNEEKSFEIFQF